MRALKGLESAVSLSVTHWQWAKTAGLSGRPRALFPIRFTTPNIFTRSISPTIRKHRVAPQRRCFGTRRKAASSTTNPPISCACSMTRLMPPARELAITIPNLYEALIDALNERIYQELNNGVYKAGFATSQQAYDEAALAVFTMLDELEGRLAQSRYLFGERPVETDWRLFTTLVRFDAVYVGHFKCNLRRLIDYPNLSRYARDLFQFPGISATVNFEHIRKHYYTSHKSINPTGIIPIGPELDFSAGVGK